MNRAITWIVLSLAAILLYVPVPVINAVTPDKVINRDTVSLTISGDRFVKSSVKLARTGEPDILPTVQRVVSKTEIACTFQLKDSAAGKWDIVVTNKGKKTTVLAGGLILEYPAPTAAGIEPNRAESDTEVAVRIFGADLRKGLKVQLAKEGQILLAAAGAEIVDGNRADCTFALKGLAPETYDLVLTNDDGKSAVLTGAFSVTKPTPAPVVEIAPPPPAPDLNFVRYLKPVFFDYDRFTVREDQVPALVEDAKAINEKPNLYIVIGGNADERGTDAYNDALSNKRAEAIKKLLVGMGINPEKIIIYAYGRTKPYLAGHDEAALAYNRRADISLWERIPDKEEAVPKQ